MGIFFSQFTRGGTGIGAKKAGKIQKTAFFASSNPGTSM
jgi:hypothetical protein